MTTPATFTTKIKCLNCQLHYQVHSWRADWSGIEDGGYCPECGSHDYAAKLIWQTTSEKPIFMHVPGDATLISMEEVTS